MEISSLQSIRLFGLWDQPRNVMTWDDVKTRCLSWRKLRDRYHFSALELHTLQPAKNEWVKRGALTLHDMLDMTVFPINPVIDMHADLAELWSMHWSVDEMRSMHVTYAQMKRAGLNHMIMLHFGFSLAAWSSLELQTEHVEAMQDDEVRLLFGMPKSEVLCILDCACEAHVL